MHCIEINLLIIFKKNVILESITLQCADLMGRRKTVLNDKKKITTAIAELDQKKNKALKEAHSQVNKVRPTFHQDLKLFSQI